jgi:hypothetical protein
VSGTAEVMLNCEPYKKLKEREEENCPDNINKF